jgi:acetylornithine deacetylase/succinyl-diaminopimelate desuccinylase-like protein
LSSAGHSPARPDLPTSIRSWPAAVLRELVEIKTTEGGVGATPAAQAVARRLLAAGFPAADVKVLGPSPRKHNVVARIHGSGKAKPILLLAHLDVVEANAADWSPGLDPFKLTEKDGYFYGRGTQDDKHSAAILVANFIRWKKEKWVPDRDLILALTADEEAYGDEVGVPWLLKNHRELIDAEYCLNLDAGDFQTKDGKPYLIGVAAAEKKETMIELAIANRGGHGSVPRPDNAIYRLAHALEKVESVTFPAMLAEVTRTEFSALAKLEHGEMASDMATLGAASGGGRGRVHCSGLARSLLQRAPPLHMHTHGAREQPVAQRTPQRATVNLNCRILPWHEPDSVIARLRQVIADDSVTVKWTFREREPQPASPLRPELFRTLEQFRDRIWPGAVVTASLETGGTDGRFLRGAGMPAYGISGVFMEQGDVRAHGADERIRIKNFDDGVTFYDAFVKALLKQP